MVPDGSAPRRPRIDRLAWSKADQARLYQARSNAGHSQAECGAALGDFGAGNVTAKSVGTWENGAVDAVDRRNHAALEKYIARWLPPTNLVDRQQRRMDGVPDPTELLDPAQPDLHGRRGDFIDALTQRLREGPPMTEADRDTQRDLAEILGLREGRG